MQNVWDFRSSRQNTHADRWHTPPSISSARPPLHAKPLISCRVRSFRARRVKGAPLLFRLRLRRRRPRRTRTDCDDSDELRSKNESPAHIHNSIDTSSPSGKADNIGYKMPFIKYMFCSPQGAVLMPVLLSDTSYQICNYQLSTSISNTS